MLPSAGSRRWNPPEDEIDGNEQGPRPRYRRSHSPSRQAQPALLRELRAAAQSDDSTIYIPAIVITEANQSKQLAKKRIETILEIADVKDLDGYIAEKAAEGLRALERAKCKACSGFVGPGIIDAIVMALAHEYVKSNSEAIVFTGDMGDMESLRDAWFEGVTLRRC